MADYDEIYSKYNELFEQMQAAVPGIQQNQERAEQADEEKDRQMEFAVGAMPSLRRSEPAGAGPLLMLTSFVYASSISHFRWATIFLDLLAL